MTGTYIFQIGFYGLTEMLAEIQKTLDYTLIGLKNTCWFLDDILIVSRGSVEKHKHYVLNCLKRLDDEAQITLKKLHSFLGQVNYVSNFISNLAQFSHPLFSLLKKPSEIIWNDVY